MASARLQKQVLLQPTQRAALAASCVLSFSAAPSFAAMGLFTALDREPLSTALCSFSIGGRHLTGMVAMYGLMTLFHLKPWLRLLYSQQG